jgi:hypothetical protein
METIPDNYDFFRMHEDEQDEWLEQRPVCVCCGDHIQDDYCYDVGGEIYCEDCMVSCFRKVVWCITDPAPIVGHILIQVNHVIAWKRKRRTIKISLQHIEVAGMDRWK